MQENLRSKTYRETSSYALLIALVLLLFIVTAFLDLHTAAAQQTQELMEEGGRDISVVDWLYHLPLAMGVALLVVAVDAVVIVQILRGRWGRE